MPSLASEKNYFLFFNNTSNDTRHNTTQSPQTGVIRDEASDAITFVMVTVLAAVLIFGVFVAVVGIVKRMRGGQVRRETSHTHGWNTLASSEHTYDEEDGLGVSAIDSSIEQIYKADEPKEPQFGSLGFVKSDED